VRELEFSKIWFRLNTADEGEKEDIIADKKLDTRDFLEQALVSLHPGWNQRHG